MKRALIFALAIALASCTRGEHREAREKYNDGLAALGKGELADAEKLLLEARGAAGVDPELRFRAAYDLGLAFAADADKQKSELAKAIALEQQAVSWFADALDLRKDDRDAAANLTIARARLQAMNDEQRRGEAKLEARLDAAIGNQRGVLAGARGAWQPIKKTHGADPLGQQSALQRLADEERGIGAEVGVIEDLATDEIDTIAKKAEDKRSPEEKARIVQLKNLGVYIAEARSRVADARRRLQQLAAEEAVGRAESALVALKRAREQLLDPITVLRGVGADELELARDTTATADAFGKRLDAGSAAPRAALPAWLAPGALLERQTALRERLDEVRARLGAATQAPPDDKQDARAKKLLERVKRAVPLVTDASSAMDRSRTGLGDKKLDDALVAERDALVAIGKAIEQFADLKQTIDLASETQKRVVELLGPDAAKQMTAAERARETKEGIAQNAARVERLKELIADEREQEEEKKKTPAAGAGSGAGSNAKEDDKQKEIEARIEQLKTAEVLRADAAKLAGELDAAIAKNGDALAAAKAVDAKLDELRKLFFSVIEHLEQLVLDQSETQDRTNAASGDDDAARAPKLPELIAREDQHGAMAKAITDALAAQADAANKQPQGQPQQQRGPSGKQLAAAAEEVRLGGGDMADAKAAIDKARTTTTQTISLKPAVESQTKAVAHLKNALALLQPPKQQKQDDDKQDQQQQPQPQPQSGAGQRARDEDAKRQRRRHGGNEPVEKDW